MGIVTTSSVKIHVAGQVIDLEGGGGVPGPNTVGTEQIKDGAVIENDLNDDVKKGLHELDDRSKYGTETDVDNIFNKGAEAVAPVLNVEEEEEP